MNIASVCLELFACPLCVL